MALVLAALEDRHPGFSCHIFAISGVSGGSLGAAVFNALIAERRAQDPGGSDCAKPADLERIKGQESWNCDRKAKRLCNQAQTVLGRDFLAPTIAGMLFPDLVQRFLPFAWLPDRQSYLEQAWEAAWNEEVRNTGRMAADFLALWENRNDKDARVSLPALLLNTTEVARGGRAIISNLRINDASAQPDGALGGFVAAQDVLTAIDKPIRLSTAAGLSARFSYVSPAANTGKNDINGRPLRYVDGGYFENSGTLTALELMQTGNLLTDDAEQRKRFRPIVLAITNSTVEGLDDGSWLEVLLSETLPPLDSLLHSRVARGEHATRELAISMVSKGSEVIRADLPPLEPIESDNNPVRKNCREESKVVRAVPLSWMLADDVKRYVDCMAQPQIQEVEKKLHQLLRNRSS